VSLGQLKKEQKEKEKERETNHIEIVLSKETYKSKREKKE